MLNGLHSTPETGQACRQLLDAVIPHVSRTDADPDILAYGTPVHESDTSDTSEDSEDDEPPRKRRRGPDTLPAYPYGLVFLKTIRTGDRYPVPRLSRSDFNTKKVFHHFFQMGTESLQQELVAKTMVQATNPNRVSNNARQTPRWDDSRAGQRIRKFKLAAKGYTLLPPPVDGGSDLGSEEEGDVEIGEDINAAIQRVWHQFLLDITAKVPNRRGFDEPSYCKLSADERSRVTEATYTNQELSDYFLDCQWKLVAPQTWLRLFNRLWPKKGINLSTGKVQNYKSTEYYKLWAVIRQRADEETVEGIRKAIKRVFDKLYWMPNAQGDRIWRTKHDPTFQKSSGIDLCQAAPQILINGVDREHVPIWQV